MKQVMNYHKDNGLLNMIRRTDPMIVSPIYGKDNKEGTGIMSYGSYRTIQNYEVEYGVEKILKNVPEDHPSSMNLHIK